MQGGRWGNNLEYQATPDLLSLNKYSVRRHDSLLGCCNYMPLNNDDSIDKYNSSWGPSSLIYVHRNYGAVADNSIPSEEELKELQAAFDNNYPGDNLSVAGTDLQYQWVKGFNQLRNFQLYKIRVGDDVSIMFSGTKSTFSFTSISWLQKV